ncbi:hypothetical protein EVAR_44371_1 [Eumeta japonica]|uniref:Uncharacterized protein n=1 Tax=Eumeta variegata TaxID=151549 RepID=A0A4C1X5U6_EUMVA|nr:hypothetical protein EVAR_44371_1 [Eumeta japonica]
MDSLIYSFGAERNLSLISFLFFAARPPPAAARRRPPPPALRWTTLPRPIKAVIKRADHYSCRKAHGARPGAAHRSDD